jgi:hypothetical protein
MPELETKVSIDITVNCSDCGRGLTCDINEDKWGSPIIKVYPCLDCLAGEYERGIEEGEKNAT